MKTILLECNSVKIWQFIKDQNTLEVYELSGAMLLFYDQSFQDDLPIQQPSEEEKQARFNIYSKLEYTLILIIPTKNIQYQIDSINYFDHVESESNNGTYFCFGQLWRKKIYSI